MRLLLDTTLPAAKRGAMSESEQQAARADVAASFQRVAVEHLAERTARAHSNPNPNPNPHPNPHPDPHPNPHPQQVPLLLHMGEPQLALEKAIGSGDTELLHLVLLHAKDNLPL